MWKQTSLNFRKFVIQISKLKRERVVINNQVLEILHKFQLIIAEFIILKLIP